MNIFNSLGSNYNFFYVVRALTAPNKKIFSTKLKKFLANKYQGKVALSYKGRTSLALALNAFKLPRDSYVAATGFTCPAVDQGIVKAGLKAEYLKTDDGLNFSAHSLLIALKKNENIKVVIVQNTLGSTCNITKIKKICTKHNLLLIEDLAHSVGTKYSNGKEVGKVADATFFSFSQDKMIDSISGGAVVMRNKKYRQHLKSNLESKPHLLDRLYPLFTFLIRLTYPIKIGKVFHKILKVLNLLKNPMAVKNAGMSHWQANIALKELKSLEKNITHRNKISAIYQNNLICKKISTPLRFTIFIKSREELIRYLKNQGLYISDIWYDKPMQPSHLSETILNLPTHRNISPKNAKEISNLINQWTKNLGKK